MFVVTGLHTKRRPRITSNTPSALINSSSSRLAPSRVSETRMIQLDGDMDASNRSEQNRRLPTIVSLGRVAPPRVRKFIPKPLILVERMKARRLLLESSPPLALDSRFIPSSLTRSGTTIGTPFSAHVTPPTRRVPTSSVLSSDLHSSSSISIRVSSRNGVVFGSGFGMMPRPARPLSGVTLGDGSSSTDTFVADSPCCIKRALSEVPLLVMATDPTNLCMGVEPNPDILVDPVAMGHVQRTRPPNDQFEPVMTSTPFLSQRITTASAPFPAAFISSTHSANSLEQLPKLSDNFHIVSPTSRAACPFNAPEDTYIVKLPNNGSVAPDAPFRLASPAPALVLDGVFALPRPSPSSLSRRMLQGFPRPRKPTSHRPFVDTSNATLASPSQPPSTPPSSCRRQFGPESPRSKLAHVLTAHAQPPTTARRKLPRVPPLVRGVLVSNDPRTQCEIEGLRIRKVVGLGRGGSGAAVCGEGSGRGTTERMSLASVGMVAKLRARWETGTTERCDDVHGRA